MNSTKSTPRRVLIVVTMMVALIIVGLLPMAAEATVPAGGAVSQCIQGCTKSLAGLTSGYCLTLCSAEFHPLSAHPHHHEHDHSHAHVRVDAHAHVDDHGHVHAHVHAHVDGHGHLQAHVHAHAHALH
ncbi:hypothetical protein SDJN02_13643, partial [Cucurbita argyrosperma subsp. argyrosperma]